MGCSSHKKIVSILSNDDLSDLGLGYLPHNFFFYLSIDLLSGLGLGCNSQKNLFQLCTMTISQVRDWVVFYSKTLFQFCLMPFSQVSDWVVIHKKNYISIRSNDLLSVLKLGCH